MGHIWDIRETSIVLDRPVLIFQKGQAPPPNVLESLTGWWLEFGIWYLRSIRPTGSPT